MVFKFLLFFCTAINCFSNRYGVFNASKNSVEVGNVKGTTCFSVKLLGIDPLGGTTPQNSSDEKIVITSNSGIILETMRNYQGGKTEPEITILRKNNSTETVFLSNKIIKKNNAVTQNFSATLIADPCKEINEENFESFQEYASRTYSMIIIGEQQKQD